MNLKHQLLIRTFLIFFAINSSILAQNPFDCIDAIEACGDSTIEIDFELVEGTVEEEITDFCSTNFDQSLLNENTVWIKYQFKTSGDFLFTISSKVENNDIDFVVFTSESKTCDDLNAIRCMFSGPNFNGGMIQLVCLGPTGLSPSSIDISESGGCTGDDDNFLAPVEVNAGDVLYLAVMSFSLENEYTIEHGGSAEISCITATAEELNNPDVKIYPNPASDILNLEVEDVQNKNYKLELFNSTGTKVKMREFSNSIALDISELSCGIYYVKIWSEDLSFHYQKISKI